MKLLSVATQRPGGFLLPGSEYTADEKQFADVPGVVIGNLQGLAEKGLSVSVGEGGEEIGSGVGYEFSEGGEVVVKGANGVVPGLVVGRFSGGGPVAGGPVGRFMGGIATEFEHVPLTDAEVFEHLPGTVGNARGADAAQLGGEIGDDVIEIGVGVSFGEEEIEFAAKGVGMFHGFHRVFLRVFHAPLS